MSGSLGLGGGQSSSKSKSETIDVTPSEYAGLRGPLADILKQYMSTGGPQYTGPLAAQMTGQEQSSLANVLSQSNGVSPLSSAAQGELLKNLQGGYTDLSTNPFLQSSIAAATRPISQQAEQQRLTDRATFGIANQRLDQSSPFAQASALRDRAELDAISSATSDIGSKAYEAERGRQFGSVAASEALTAGQFNRTVEGLKAAALPRLIEQLGIDNGLKEFQRRQDAILQAAGIAAQASTLFGTKSSSSSKAWNANMSSSGGVGGGSDGMAAAVI